MPFMYSTARFPAFLKTRKLSLLFILCLACLFLIFAANLKKKYGYSEVLIEVPFCGNCQKRIKVRNPYIANKSTNKNDPYKCSTAIDRGLHQKVVGYSFYDGPQTSDTLHRDFFQGIKKNLREIETLHSKLNDDGHEYTMRLYFQLYPKSKVKNQICEMACNEPNLDICPMEYSNKHYPMLWRFYPTIDPNVDVFFSRDLDSRIKPREISAVEEFLTSDKHFHIMRDHWQHGVPILGGMWGVKLTNNTIRSKVDLSMKGLFKDNEAFASREQAQHDQNLLAGYIWPLSQNLSMEHDSYLCRNFVKARPFPTRRKEEVLNFVGAQADINSTIVAPQHPMCPWECRPKTHKDWYYC